MTGPQPGDYGLWRTPWSGWAPRAVGGWLLGWLIRWGTRSNFNHAVLYVGDGEVGESLGDGFVIHHDRELDAYVWSTGAVPVTDAERVKIVAAAHAMQGVPYGYLDILALALSTRGLCFKWAFDRIARTDTSICSQAVARCWDEAGIELVAGKLACEVTPGDLDDVRLHKAVPRRW